MKRFYCTVPWLDGRPLINAAGPTEEEARANVKLLNLSDMEKERVIFLDAELSVDTTAIAS
jgi:hypothetical protein